MAVPAAMLAGCYDYGEDAVTSSDPVTVELAYTLSSLANGQTRQADVVMTSASTAPRLPSTIRLIPLDNDAPQMEDVAWEDDVVSKDNPRSGFYRSSHCQLQIGINGCLVYGSVLNLAPPTGVDTKMYNGSLIEKFPNYYLTTTDVTDGISFSLEPIYNESDGTPTGASTLAGYLNDIARAGGTDATDGWSASTNDYLEGLLKKFTNDGKILPGSAASVKAWISDFKANYLDNDKIPSALGDAEKTMLQNVRTVVEAKLTAIGDVTSSSYPRNISLPDGAAALKWIAGAFQPMVNTTTLSGAVNNINSMSRFAYPAPLYYFIDSDIKTSNKKVDFETVYDGVTTTAEKTAWQNVLTKEEFEYNVVTPNTKAVALVNPVQYGVAQLQVNIKASAVSLPDASSENITVGANSFPLTGVIVCDQRPVNFKFEQNIIEEGAVSDADVLFIYDNQVGTHYLTYAETGVWHEGCKTLVLQSQPGEDVNIVLEFENNSGTDFACIDGTVYQGTRFYLIGKVEAARYNTSDGTVTDDNKTQVFTKDYVTTVNMTVSSLAKAYNVPPNLLSNNLEISVVTTPQWVAATPTVKRLE